MRKPKGGKELEEEMARRITESRNDVKKKWRTEKRDKERNSETTSQYHLSEQK